MLFLRAAVCFHFRSYNRYCFENRQTVVCEMPQLGMCNNFNEPHELDPCDGVGAAARLGVVVALLSVAASYITLQLR